MEKVGKPNTQHPKACLFVHLELPPASTNTTSFALTLGGSPTGILWTAQRFLCQKCPMVTLNPLHLNHSSADHS